MRTIVLLLTAAVLSACAAVPPPLPPVGRPVDGVPSYGPADARALAEREVRQVLGETAWAEISQARTAVYVRRGVSLPRMVQQPDGSWKPEGPYANAAVRTAQGWVGWPGGVRSLLTPETGRELDRLLAQPELWTEPFLPGSGCTDPGGLTSVIRRDGREHVATHPCGDVGLTGQVARIVMASRIVDWAAVPLANLPAGITLGRFPDQIEQYFRYSSAVRDPVSLVITSPAEWDGMWRRIVANHGNPPGAPPVDFSREMLLLSAMGTQPSGGYAIHVDRVIDNGSFLEVLVTRTSPGPRCGATAALTNPVDVVRIPVTTRPVRWSMRDVQTVCP